MMESRFSEVRGPHIHDGDIDHLNIGLQLLRMLARYGKEAIKRFLGEALLPPRFRDAIHGLRAIETHGRVEKVAGAFSEQTRKGWSNDDGGYHDEGHTQEKLRHGTQATFGCGQQKPTQAQDQKRHCGSPRQSDKDLSVVIHRLQNVDVSGGAAVRPTCWFACPLVLSCMIGCWQPPAPLIMTSCLRLSSLECHESAVYCATDPLEYRPQFTTGSFPIDLVCGRLSSRARL